MTEREKLEDEYFERIDRHQPLTDEETTLLRKSFRAGFLACRELVMQELKWVGPYHQARDLPLSEFLGARYLKISVIGDTEVERFLPQED